MKLASLLMFALGSTPFNSSTQFEWGRSELWESRGFDSVATEDGKQLKTIRDHDRTRLVISLRSREFQINEEPKLWIASGSVRKGHTHSGLPIGVANAWPPKGDLVSATVSTLGPWESCRVGVYRVWYRQSRQESMIKVPESEFASMLEVVSRDLLAHFASRRLAPDGNVSIGGRSYSAMRASGTDARFIDFAAWTSAHGLTVSTGQEGTVKSFTKGGTLWIVPLASNKIKKGSAWQTLPDIVMQKDGKTMIPIAGLSN